MKKILKFVLTMTLIFGVCCWGYKNRISLTPDEDLVKMYVVNEYDRDWDRISIEINNREDLHNYDYIHYYIYERGGDKLYCRTSTEDIKKQCESYF